MLAREACQELFLPMCWLGRHARSYFCPCVGYGGLPGIISVHVLAREGVPGVISVHVLAR